MEVLFVIHLLYKQPGQENQTQNPNCKYNLLLRIYDIWNMKRKNQKDKFNDLNSLFIYLYKYSVNFKHNGWNFPGLGFIKKNPHLRISSNPKFFLKSSVSSDLIGQNVSWEKTWVLDFLWNHGHMKYCSLPSWLIIYKIWTDNTYNIWNIQNIVTLKPSFHLTFICGDGLK